MTLQYWQRKFLLVWMRDEQTRQAFVDGEVEPLLARVETFLFKNPLQTYSFFILFGLNESAHKKSRILVARNLLKIVGWLVMVVVG